MQLRGRYWGGKFSPDGREVLTINDEDRTGRLWDANTGMPIGTPLNLQDGIWNTSFSPDGRTVLSVVGQVAAALGRRQR